MCAPSSILCINESYFVFVGVLYGCILGVFECVCMCVFVHVSECVKNTFLNVCICLCEWVK